MRAAAGLVPLLLGVGVLAACAGSAGRRTSRAPQTAAGEPERPTCTVTYVANAGFLVETPDHKVLLDGLFGGLEGDWCDQPDGATLSALLAGEPPFDGVDVVTISHAHVDHFDADLVAAFALRHRRTPILCPPQVAARLRGHPDHATFAGSLRVLPLAPGERRSLDLDGLVVDAWRLGHGAYLETDELTAERRDRHRDVENLAFVLRLDGFTVLHTGDAGPQSLAGCAARPGWPDEIDLALLGRSFAFDARAPGIDAIADELRPRHVLLTHVEPGAAPRYRAVAAQVRDRIPDLTLLDRPLDRRRFGARAEPAR